MYYNNIIFYAEAFPPNRGGGENYSVELCSTLTLFGYKVELITPVESKKEDHYPFIVTRIPNPIKLGGFNVNIFYIIKSLIKNRSSILHIGGPTAIDSFLILFCKIVKIPVVVTFHGQFNSKLGKLIQSIAGKLFYPLTDRVLVQSNRDMDFLSNMNQSTKIKLLYFNGVDRNKYKCEGYPERSKKLHQNARFNFIFIGGLSTSRPYKGVEKLIMIFKKLTDTYKYNSVNLTIVGGGDLLPTLESLAKSYVNIVFKGNLTDDELIRELCKSDALILPSVSEGEGFGKVVLESISCGKPVLVSKYAGIAELIEKYKAGLVFDPNDIECSVQKILFLLNNRSCLIDYKKNGENLIKYEDLDLISSTAKTIEIYKDISNRGGKV
jgi:glycosyltransferase involved in cell wall biosynthesis